MKKFFIVLLATMVFDSAFAIESKGHICRGLDDRTNDLFEVRLDADKFALGAQVNIFTSNYAQETNSFYQVLGFLETGMGTYAKLKFTSGDVKRDYLVSFVNVFPIDHLYLSASDVGVQLKCKEVRRELTNHEITCDIADTYGGNVGEFDVLCKSSSADKEKIEDEVIQVAEKACASGIYPGKYIQVANTEFSSDANQTVAFAQFNCMQSYCSV